MLPRFWRVEEFEGDNTYTIEEKTYKSIFDKTVIREPYGRFTVHLPFRENSLRLGVVY
jgi:hypothetical protein